MLIRNKIENKNRLRLLKKHGIGGAVDDLLSSLASVISRGDKNVASAVVSRVESGAIDVNDLAALVKSKPQTGSIILPRSSKYKPAVLTKPGTAPTTFNGKPLSELSSPSGAPITSKFYTEQGSEYIMAADGSTQRIKSVHSNTGGSDIGLHGWAQKALFTKGEEGSIFNTAGVLLMQEGIPFTITSKEGKLQYLLYDGSQWRTAMMSDVFPKSVQAGKANVPIATEFSTTPELGSHILEISTKDNIVKKIHPGSDVSYIEKQV